MNNQELKQLMLTMIDDLESKGDGQYSLTISEDIASAVAKALPSFVWIAPAMMLWPDARQNGFHQMVTVNRTMPPKTWAWSLKT